MVAVSWAAVCFGGCGQAAPTANEPAPSSSIADRIFDGDRSSADRLPSTAYEADYGETAVDLGSSRWIPIRARGYRMWVTRALGNADAAWRSAFDREQICVHLFGRRAKPVAFQCAPIRDADRPRRLLIVLSGGAEGAPGLRPREVVIAGIAPVGSSSASIVTTRGAEIGVAVKRQGFLRATRAPIAGLRVESANGMFYEIPLNGCQDC